MRGTPLSIVGVLLLLWGATRSEEAFGPHGTFVLQAISVALIAVGLVLLATQILERPRR